MIAGTEYPLHEQSNAKGVEQTIVLWYAIQLKQYAQKFLWEKWEYM